MATKPQVTNIVLLGYLTEEIDICRFSKLVNLVYFDNFKIKYGNKNKIKNGMPFLGLEGAIISSSYDNESRGVRLKSSIKAFSGVDLQCSGKNIYVKVSKCKLLLMGVLNMKMGDLAFGYLLEHIKMTEENWSKVRMLSKEKQLETINWVKDNLLGKGSFTELPDHVDKHFATLLYYNLHDHDMTSEEYFSKRIKDILYNIQKPIYTTLPAIKYKRISNSVLNYKLGQQISLIETMQKLLEIGCYKVGFHNAVSRNRKAKATIPIETIENLPDINEINIITPSTREEFSPISTETEDDIEDEDDDEDENKKKVHTFSFSQSSSVTQYSPTNYMQAIKAYKKLCSDLGFESLI